MKWHYHVTKLEPRQVGLVLMEAVVCLQAERPSILTPKVTVESFSACKGK